MYAENKDIIIYVKGGAVGTDKNTVKTNSDLSSHYSGKHDFSDVAKIVINPREVLAGIKDKLTATEWFVLEKLTKR